MSWQATTVDVEVTERDETSGFAELGVATTTSTPRSKALICGA